MTPNKHITSYDMDPTPTLENPQAKHVRDERHMTKYGDNEIKPQPIMYTGNGESWTLSFSLTFGGFQTREVDDLILRYVGSRDGVVMPNVVHRGTKAGSNGGENTVGRIFVTWNRIQGEVKGVLLPNPLSRSGVHKLYLRQECPHYEKVLMDGSTGKTGDCLQCFGVVGGGRACTRWNYDLLNTKKQYDGVGHWIWAGFNLFKDVGFAQGDSPDFWRQGVGGEDDDDFVRVSNWIAQRGAKSVTLELMAAVLESQVDGSIGEAHMLEYLESLGTSQARPPQAPLLVLTSLNLLSCIFDTDRTSVAHRPLMALMHSNTLMSPSIMSDDPPPHAFWPTFVRHNSTETQQSFYATHSGRCLASASAGEAAALVALAGVRAGMTRDLDLVDLDGGGWGQVQDSYEYHRNQVKPPRGGVPSGDGTPVDSPDPSPNPPESELYLGKLEYYGRAGVDANQVLAARRFANVAYNPVAPDHLRAEAMYNLGVMHLHGQGGLPPSEGDAYRLWREAADRGSVNAMNGMSSFYQRDRVVDGAIVKRNETKAREWVEMAADAGDRGALYELGTAYLRGQKLGVAVDFGKAARFLAEGVLLGHPNCMYELGNALVDSTSWLAQLGRIMEMSPIDLDGEIVDGQGFASGLKFMVVRRGGQEFSLPLGFDCYTGRRLLLSLAHMGKWTHGLIDSAVAAYEEGDEERALTYMDVCAISGVLTCAENSREINGILGGSERFALARTLAMANDDDPRAVAELADCYWGLGGWECRAVEDIVGVDRELAWKLYQDASALGDEKATFDVAVMWWTGGSGVTERNRTKAKEMMRELETWAVGWIGARAALVAMEWSEWVENLWNSYVQWINGLRHSHLSSLATTEL